RRVHYAILADQPGRHLSVTEDILSIEALKLNSSRPHNALANCRAGFGRNVARQLSELHRRHVDVDVYAVEQRAGYLRDVALDLDRAAFAVPRRIVEVTAGTRVHRGGKHEP